MPEAEGLPRNEQLAEKRSFEGNCEILRTIFQPWALFYNIAGSQEGVYLLYNPPINFFHRASLWEKGKNFSARKSSHNFV